MEFFFFGRVENIVGKGEDAGYQHILLFIRPLKTGRIMGSPVAFGSAGGVPHSLSSAYLQNYTSYGYKKLDGWIDLMKMECSVREL